MTFKIDKDVPVPKRRGPYKYPFRDMKAGDSFKFPISDVERVRSAASYFGLRNDCKFKVHKVSKTHARCWRI